MNDATYPDNWPEIAAKIKDAADWHCEHCGRPHDVAAGYCLTVHHLNGDKSDCRYENLLAACQRCHLRIQATYHPEHPEQITLPGFDKPEWMIRRGL